MTDSKKKKSASSKSKGSTRGKKNSSSKKELPKNVKRKEANGNAGQSFSSQLLPYIMIVVAVFCAVCMFAGSGAGIVGGAIRTFFLGISGGVAYALPFLVVIPVFTYGRDKEEGTFAGKIISLCVIYVLASVLLHVFMKGSADFSVVEHWNNGAALKGGGVIGGLLGELMLRAFGKVGTLVLVFAVLFVPVLYLFGITPRGLWILVRYKLRVARENGAEKSALRRERARQLDEERERYIRERKNLSDDQLKMEIKENQGAEVQTAEPMKFKVKVKRKFSPDVPIDDVTEEEAASVEEKPAQAENPTEDEIDERIFDEVMRRTKARMVAENEAASGDDSTTEAAEATPTVITETIAPIGESGEVTEEKKDSASVDLKKIFVNPEDAELLDRLAEAYLSGDRDGVSSGATDAETMESELTIVRSELGETAAEEPKVPQKKEYVFPPVSLITEDTEKRDGNIKEELHANAVKLVETLRSFNVKTKIENVSRGPTITRYELLPEAGIRVRSILNLVDDIALNLATTGVRIEAPIPGKSAVGIEVPNKNRATVHLRTLLEDQRFRNASSKLLCALGEDVGGESVYLDIAKMPHLLIAGATGMGKSVCINSLIVSLLYNASPEEVKLILIDPKKVELNIYNGIPHLLVPVVSDPKKAAGSLSWAVSEMERRFGLIEAVGVRDVNMYNKLTADDPAYEFLPYIVIIIDELADLMMTAPDDVEESVCRLMQKARAAGMHVIIGTQRPSVDVITGLIKANIPSRIAFTVASQVDSRTIIDRAGAESLIGRGDMLYLPVGASKPVRVQGAFVSEADVENVVTFIKNANVQNEVEYANDVIEQIEKEAAKCGMGKKGGGASVAASGDDGDDDPMLRSALELAVNSGKISTSLIQRRLSLGYGRAAKLIDRMEQLGYVSAPEGQKPREVLITKEQFMELVLKREDELL